MGLEIVELVMKVEDEFGVRIPDDVAGAVHTVGQLYDYLLTAIRTHGKGELRARPDLDALVWRRLCEMCAALAVGVKAPDVKRETRFIQDLSFG